MADRPDEIIRPRDMQRETGLSRTTIWRLERSGQFPQRVRLTLGGAVGYRRSQIEAWRNSLQNVGVSHG